MPKSPKHPRPAVEIYARLLGRIQWLCPHCNEIYGSKQFPWRTARVVCNQCERAYRVGLAFTRHLSAAPPFNALFAGQYNGFTANRIEPGIGDPIFARIVGRVDWVCPACELPQSAVASRDVARITCETCALSFFVAPIFYAAARRPHLGTPHDWSVYETIQSTLAGADDSDAAPPSGQSA